MAGLESLLPIGQEIPSPNPFGPMFDWASKNTPNTTPHTPHRRSRICAGQKQRGSFRLWNKNSLIGEAESTARAGRSKHIYIYIKSS